ncbi:glycoside hydrolase family 3 [Cohnella kolymensis]|uniref:beta-N-acetylhexosaminidase n=1 Tax=Cohnella kolymensis TaxID=1590652 RepID=A0ABR5A982_9BACL|nr:beta-N-acetylhexosaminidase [Cohnella kolymensis]KIL37601.1 glycoside hydrolase family 3 [Cohnella kolymensis]
MENLSLREKIGQLIVTGFPAPHITDDLRSLARDYKIGNIILFSHNVENAAQLRALCADLQRLITDQTGHPALISIDQEGGRVTRLPADATNVPGAMAIASTGRSENAYAAGRITARELCALGINFNLAPVLDINNNKENPVINVRSYGDTAETVEEYGLQMMRGLQDGGVLASIKHFPGHGDTAVDSHLGLPVIEKSIEQLMELELKPFIAAIESGAEAITTAHILFPLIDAERVPATMSRTIITELLKEKLGYKGLVISDCLEMEAVRKYYGTAKGALGALKAGVHLIFVSHTPSLVKETVEVIEQAVQSGELSMSLLDDAVEKVLFYKDKYGILAETELSVVGGAVHLRAATAISVESICHVRGKLATIEKNDKDTIFVGSYPYRADQASSRVNARLCFPAVMAEAFAAAHLIINIDPEEAEIDELLKKAEGYSRVVVGMFNALDNSGQLELVNRLYGNGHQVTAVALGKPYDLEALQGDICGLAAFEYTPLALNSVIQILSGAAQPAGKVSIALLE